MLRSDNVVDGMLVHTLPRELFVAHVPLKHLPKDHSTREDVDLVVVLWVWMPELGSLPIDRTNHAPDHRTCGLLYLCQAEVGDLRHTLGGDEDVRRLAVTVNDRWFACMEILQTAGDV